MTEPIVRHGGILCSDLQVKTRHSWIHQLQPTRRACSVVFVATLTGDWRTEWNQLSCHSTPFSLSSQPYLLIFRGYLHGLWAGRANVGLVICHSVTNAMDTTSTALLCPQLTPSNLHLSISSATSTPLVNWAPGSFPFPHLLHLVTLNHSTNTKKWGYSRELPASHWPYQYKIPPLIKRHNGKLNIWIMF